MQNFSFRMEEAAMDKEERLKQQIEAYQPFNLQEEQDRQRSCGSLRRQNIL